MESSFCSKWNLSRDGVCDIDNEEIVSGNSCWRYSNIAVVDTGLPSMTTCNVTVPISWAAEQDIFVFNLTLIKSYVQNKLRVLEIWIVKCPSVLNT